MVTDATARFAPMEWRSSVQRNIHGVLSVNLEKSASVNIAGLSVEDDSTVLERDQSRRVPSGECQVVKIAQHGGSVISIDLLEVAHDAMRRRRIETGYRLIGQHQRRRL